MKTKVKLLRNTPEEEAAIQRGIDADPDNPEATAEDFKRARPASEVLSPEFLANWKKGGHTIKHVTDAEYEATKRRGRPPSDRKKEPVNLRLDPEVLAFFRATGAGWQTRVNAALSAYVARRLKRPSPKA
jgi:uncharacterized protein (DUF4415 family)